MNQKYFTILLALSFALTVHSQINRDDAFAILKNTVLGSSWQDKEIYSLNNIVSNSTIVNTLDSFVVSPDYPCWFFYIDMDPSAEWWHPCKYVFIKVHSLITKRFYLLTLMIFIQYQRFQHNLIMTILLSLLVVDLESKLIGLDIGTIVQQYIKYW